MLFNFSVARISSGPVLSYDYFFGKVYFFFKIICESNIKLCHRHKSVHYSCKLHEKVSNLYKKGDFVLLVIIYVRPEILDLTVYLKSVLLRLMNLVETVSQS